MNTLRLLFTLLLLSAWPGYSAIPTSNPMEEAASASEETAPLDDDAYLAWAQGIWDSLDRQTGKITLSEASATLDVPESFYFLDSADAQKVLVEVWGNPPGQKVLGMLFPEEVTPFDGDAWAVTIEYQEDGYVSDEDADKLDYDLMLKQMQEDAENENPARIEAGYVPISIVGWAAKPYYDADTNKMYWAKELKFGDAEQNTLNYNIRVLGRRGVMVMNFIANMDQLGMIEQNLDSVLALAEFQRGASYSDFDPELDEVAAYGIGALVAGKVLAKTGFLAMLVVFLKKFGVVIVLAIGAFAKSVFSRKKSKAVTEAE